jgi:hypothetical protein
MTREVSGTEARHSVLVERVEQPQRYQDKNFGDSPGTLIREIRRLCFDRSSQVQELHCVLGKATGSLKSSNV